MKRKYKSVKISLMFALLMLGVWGCNNAPGEEWTVRENTEAVDETVKEMIEQAESAQGEDPVETDVEEAAEEKGVNTDAGTESADTWDSNTPENAEERPETNEVIERENLEEVKPDNREEIPEKREASYEQWLAAGMIMATSMYYGEVEITEIHITGETDLEDKFDSQGVLISFIENGSESVIWSKPLEEERQEQGTLDIYTADLGFATFDTVEKMPANLDNYKKMEISDFSELISQSLLVSIYEH